MSIVKMPQSAGPLNINACSSCKKDHAQVKTFTDSEGWYFICPSTVGRVDITHAPLGKHAATPAPVVAPATGVVGEAGLTLSAETVRMLRADAAGLLSEEQWKELQVEGDVHDGAVQGRAYLATQLLAAALATPAAPGPGAAAGTGEAVPVAERLPERGRHVLLELISGGFVVAWLRAEFKGPDYWYAGGETTYDLEMGRKWCELPATGAAAATTPATGAAPALPAAPQPTPL